VPPGGGWNPLAHAGKRLHSRPRHARPQRRRPGSRRPAGGSPSAVPVVSEIEAEEEVDESVVEVLVVVEHDGRERADLEAAADVQAQHERRAERGAEPEAVAASGAIRLVVLEPARAGIDEDRAL